MRKAVLVLSLVLAAQAFGSYLSDVIEATAVRVQAEGYKFIVLYSETTTGYLIFRDPATEIGFIADISYDGDVVKWKLTAYDPLDAATVAKLIEVRRISQQKYDAAKTLEESEKAWRGIPGRIR